MKIKEWFEKDKIQGGLVSLIICNIAYIFIASYLVTIRVLHYKTLSIGLIALLMVNSIVGIVLVKKGYFKKNIVYLFMLLIIIFGVISTILAIKPEVALFGSEGRYEGLFSILYYFSLMFVCSFVKKEYKKIIVWVILLTGIIQGIYAMFQAYEIPIVVIKYNLTNRGSRVALEAGLVNKELWVTGFLINPNFLGTYMLLCLSYAIGLFFEEKERIKNIILLLIIGLFMCGLLASNSTSCAVGLICVMLYVFIYCIKNKQIIKLIELLSILTLFTMLIYWQGKTTLIKDLNQTGEEAIDIAQGNVEDTYGTKRIYIWRNTLTIVPQNLLHGVGIDNFLYAFDGKSLTSPSGRAIYDKAHNDYLQILVTEGVFCLISYIIMYGIVTLKGMEESFENKELYLILPIIGYIVQIFFNISDIAVAPIFFIAMGLILFNERKEN